MRVPPSVIRARIDAAVWIVETAPYASLDLRGTTRPYWIVSHVLEGAVVTETGGLRYSVGPGDVMVHPPNLPFSETAAGPGIHQWMGFEASSESAATLFARYPVPPVVSLGARRQTYRATFEALENVCGEPEDRPGRTLRAASLASLLLAEALAAWADAGCPPRPDAFAPPSERFAAVVAYMETRLADRLTREDLARRAFLHPGSFDRAFSAAYGRPPMRLLQEMRLARAQSLLETTEETLDAVARAAGLGDAGRLGRLFRARFGISPGAYRTRARTTRGSYLTGE
jgi:AraC-like DNA-binding protein